METFHFQKISLKKGCNTKTLKAGRIFKKNYGGTSKMS